MSSTNAANYGVREKKISPSPPSLVTEYPLDLILAVKVSLSVS